MERRQVLPQKKSAMIMVPDSAMRLAMDCLHHPYKVFVALIGFIIFLTIVKAMCQCYLHRRRNRRISIRGYAYGTENVYPAIASSDVVINNLPDRSGLYYYNKDDKTLVYEGELKVAPVVIIPENIRDEGYSNPYRKTVPSAVCVNEQVVPISPLQQSSCYYSPVYITNTNSRGSSTNEDFDYINSPPRSPYTSRAKDSYEYSRV